MYIFGTLDNTRGTFVDDSVYAMYNGYISGIIVRYDTFIVSIQVKYGVGLNSILGPVRGGNGGGTVGSISLRPSETFVSASGLFTEQMV